MRHHYFAYGSNMLVERLRAANRAPSARPVSHARLEGWRLRFDKRSTDGSGKCHLEPQPGACVHGVVYRLDENDFRTLDQAEGVGSGYHRQRIRKILLGDGTKVNAFAYLAEPGHVVEGLRPYDWYRDLVLAGAEQHQLPQDFIAHLKQIDARPDPEPDRPNRLKARQLLATLQASQGQGLFPYHRPVAARLEPNQALEHLAESTLYYPCSGRDWADPLRLFGPWVRNLRFVDPNVRLRAGSKMAHMPSEHFLQWKFLHREVAGDAIPHACLGAGPNVEARWPGFTPLTVSEVYRHRPTGREVTLHWSQADGRSMLDRFQDPLGVFFHRGDNGPAKEPGEGASGSHWLSKAWLRPVLQRLVNRGFLVTDGSCGKDYPELCRFHKNRTVDGARAVAESRAFVDEGCHFQCVGFAGPRYGPTLIWQVTKEQE